MLRCPNIYHKWLLDSCIGATWHHRLTSYDGSAYVWDILFSLFVQLDIMKVHHLSFLSVDRSHQTQASILDHEGIRLSNQLQAVTSRRSFSRRRNKKSIQWVLAPPLHNMIPLHHVVLWLEPSLCPDMNADVQSQREVGVSVKLLVWENHSNYRTQLPIIQHQKVVGGGFDQRALLTSWVGEPLVDNELFLLLSDLRCEGCEL